MPHLLDFCHEILHDILIKILPADIAAISSTCRSLNSYIKGNRLLWKDLYLLNFDNPPRKPLEHEPKWDDELQRAVRFQKILDSPDPNVKSSHIEIACEAAIHLLKNADPSLERSLNISFLKETFESQLNCNTFLFSSSLYACIGSDEHPTAISKNARQLSAKLHSMYGTLKEPLGRTRSRSAHPFARSKVYDLRNYNDNNLWGPFMDDGSMRTDWEKVESVMVVLGYSLQIFGERCASNVPMVWDRPFHGVTPNSYVPLERGDYGMEKDLNVLSTSNLIGQPDPPLDAMDPYGVTGTWRRVVCFLDYNDLYAFNFSDPIDPSTPRPPITTQEAIRLITMNLRVTKLEPPGEDDGQDLPVVHFTGTSRSMHTSWDPNANSKLRGTVRLTPEGEVRWTTLSIFHGFSEARWRSESIQIGGVRSARGVIGTWFDKDYDPNGPAGPTAFWKLYDDYGEDMKGSVGIHNLLPTFS